MLADRDPEEAQKILDPALEWMMDAVHRYERTVNQVIGEGIMGRLGAGLAHGDHLLLHSRKRARMEGGAVAGPEAHHAAF